jgi:hypothetical protein
VIAAQVMTTRCAGGFAGFPSRGSHQQERNGAVRSKRNRRQRQIMRSNVCCCEAELYLPFEQRVPISSQSGLIIKNLQQASKTTIYVPPLMDNNPNHPIRIIGSGIENILYTCWKISLLLSENGNEAVPCKIIERRVKPLEYWTRIQLNGNGSFLVEERGHLSVYCIELSNIIAKDAETLVDNICSIDPEIDANCEVIVANNKEKEQNKVVVVTYGSPSQKPENLYNALIAFRDHKEVANESSATTIVETENDSKDSLAFPFKLDNYDFAISDIFANIIKEIKIPNV